MSRTAAVTVNWNRADLTIRLLDSAMEHVRRPDVLWMVVDNGSSDNSLEEVQRWARSRLSETGGAEGATLAIVANDTNAGFAGGNNAALRTAVTQESITHAWLINNDAWLTSDALTPLLNVAAQDSNTGIVGSTIVGGDGAVQCFGGFRYSPALTTIRPIGRGCRLDSRPSEASVSAQLDYVAGASMLISMRLLREVGVLNELFFLYCEELDLAKRAREAGYALRWASDSVVNHDAGATVRSRGVHGQGSRQAAYHENLSALRYTRLHHPLLLPIAWAARLTFKSLSITKRRAWHEFGALAAAYRDFAAGRARPQSAAPSSVMYFK